MLNGLASCADLRSKMRFEAVSSYGAHERDCYLLRGGGGGGHPFHVPGQIWKLFMVKARSRW